jgi:uncharacterized protein (UPF0264 family)
MLASVRSLKEALLVLDAGVDMIDLKNPMGGALGALDQGLVKDIVHAINHRNLVSATIGDLPMQPKLIFDATESMLDLGVDIVKIGLFGESSHVECLTALKPLAANNKLIAVMFADDLPNLDLLPLVAEMGFYGAMLDTADKNGGDLLNHMNINELAKFINWATGLRLQTGLAGSIGEIHLNMLTTLKPTYLGFRGALCEQSQRTLDLDITKINRIRSMLH